VELKVRSAQSDGLQQFNLNESGCFDRSYFTTFLQGLMIILEHITVGSPLETDPAGVGFSVL
jgi:hypothetical protein